MVFGNAGGQSGAGVGVTRDPASGEPVLWVDFLFNSQGEDVVSGRRDAHGHDELSAVLPAVWHFLKMAASQLEHAFGDMQDFEFTVQDGRLYLLQTWAGKRIPYAAARIALDLLDAGLIDADVARTRTAGLDHTALAQARIVAPDGVALVALAHAATASNGVATGEIALDEARALARHGAGVPVVLVRRDAKNQRYHGTRISHRVAHPARRPYFPCRGRRPPVGQGLPDRLYRVANRRGRRLHPDRRPHPASRRSADP